MFQLFTGDILLFKAGWNKFIIDWGHGAFYKAGGKIIESVPRGVIESSLMKQYFGREMMVLRLANCPSPEYILTVIEALKQAGEICQCPASFYDYLGIVRWIIPRLIMHKLFKKEVSLGYKPDRVYWCFEVMRTAYGRAGQILFPDNLAPIDWDYITSPELIKVWQGPVSLSELLL